MEHAAAADPFNLQLQYLRSEDWEENQQRLMDRIHRIREQRSNGMPLSMKYGPDPRRTCSIIRASLQSQNTSAKSLGRSSSKDGKNYQNVFTGIHTFSPQAHDATIGNHSDQAYNEEVWIARSASDQGTEFNEFLLY